MKRRIRKPLWQVFNVVALSFTFLFSTINTTEVKAYSQSFLDRVSTAAVQMGRETGRFPSVAIAQAILESGWGRSSLARSKNNILGMKLSSGTYRSFSSIEESMRYYGVLFTSSNGLRNHYRKFLNAKTPNEAAYALNYTYAMSGTYGDQLIQLMNSYNLYKYDEIAFGKAIQKGKVDTASIQKITEAEKAKKDAEAKAKKEAEEKAKKLEQERLLKIEQEKALKAEIERLEKNKTPSLKHEEAYKRLVSYYAEKYNLLVKTDIELIEFDGIRFQLKNQRSLLEKGI